MVTLNGKAVAALDAAEEADAAVEDTPEVFKLVDDPLVVVDSPVEKGAFEAAPKEALDPGAFAQTAVSQTDPQPMIICQMKRVIAVSWSLSSVSAQRWMTYNVSLSNLQQTMATDTTTKFCIGMSLLMHIAWVSYSNPNHPLVRRGTQMTKGCKGLSLSDLYPGWSPFTEMKTSLVHKGLSPSCLSGEHMITVLGGLALRITWR
jgi:hypothetical protein